MVMSDTTDNKNERPEVKMAKKFIDKHFLNRFKLVKDWEELSRKFKNKTFGDSGGKERFESYLKRGDFLQVNGPEKTYLVYASPEQTILADENDNDVSQSKLESELNLSVLGFTIKEIIKYLKNKKNMKPVARMTESDITRLVKKIVNEQRREDDPSEEPIHEQSTPQTIKSDPNAVKSTEELIKNIKSGFCVPVYQEGSRTRIDCKDKRYYEINYYRRFGQS